MIPHFQCITDSTGRSRLIDRTGSCLGQWRNISGRPINLDAPAHRALLDHYSAGTLDNLFPGCGVRIARAPGGGGGPTPESIVIRWPHGAELDFDIIWPAGIHDRVGLGTLERLRKREAVEPVGGPHVVEHGPEPVESVIVPPVAERVATLEAAE